MESVDALHFCATLDSSLLFCYNAAEAFRKDMQGSWSVMVTDQATREAIEYVLTRGVVQVEKDAELRHLLSTGKPLRIKLGVDPSHYDLTIGHAVVFWTLLLSWSMQN
jgi:tyrosyl-tRNA synthetase